MNSCRPVSNRSPDSGEIWYERYVYHTKRPFLFSVVLTDSKTYFPQGRKSTFSCIL